MTHWSNGLWSNRPFRKHINMMSVDIEIVQTLNSLQIYGEGVRVQIKSKWVKLQK